MANLTVFRRFLSMLEGLSPDVHLGDALKEVFANARSPDDELIRTGFSVSLDRTIFAEISISGKKLLAGLLMQCSLDDKQLSFMLRTTNHGLVDRKVSFDDLMSMHLQRATVATLMMSALPRAATIHPQSTRGRHACLSNAALPNPVVRT